MKHRISKRIALALAMCVTCVLAFGATFVRADVNSGMGGTNELQVSVADPETDVKNADAKYNVYLVATATKDDRYDTYKYKFEVDAFNELGEGFDQATMTSDSWQKMAEAAKGIVERDKIEPNNHEPVPVGEKLTGLGDGIYLVLIPDAQSQLNTYTFTPALVSVPGKVGADGAPVYNTADGRWTNTNPTVPVPMVAKWSMAPRYGSLQINKTVSAFDGQPATFTYHIVDTATNGEQYENYAAVQYTAEGVQSTTIGHLPAGMELTVTEVDSGARYSVVGSDTQTATIAADKSVAVDFQNAPNESGKVGHGIENHFVFDKDLNGGDWQLDVRAIDASEVVKS